MIKVRAHLGKNLLEACGLDAFAFLYPPNVRYLCGFTGSDGALLLAGETDCFLTDSRYSTQAITQVQADEIREYKVKVDGIAAWLREQGVRRIGFEAETLTYGTVQRLREKGPEAAEWVPVEKPILSLRGIKDDDEVSALETAAAINAAAFAEILPLIRPGVPEQELALALEFALRRHGGEDKAFDLIVASGPRGAMPHGVASNRPLAAGELVTFDFGTRVRGYHSDETVTVAVGEISPRLQEIFEVVLAAHDCAMAAVRPGVPLREIDAVARELIARRGFGDYFGHGLGHGVGLEVHEFPTLSSRSEDMAEERMVFTIEPGIYIPDLGGVRIEDTVVVTAGGCRPLTQINKGLQTFPAN
jgi:Xaa-Pro aminopeptidase